MHHPKGALLRLAYGESVAQQVEHNTFNVGVLGSSPSGFTKIQTVLLGGRFFAFIKPGCGALTCGYLLAETLHRPTGDSSGASVRIDREVDVRPPSGFTKIQTVLLGGRFFAFIKPGCGALTCGYLLAETLHRPTGDSSGASVRIDREVDVRPPSGFTNNIFLGGGNTRSYSTSTSTKSRKRPSGAKRRSTGLNCQPRSPRESKVSSTAWAAPGTKGSEPNAREVHPQLRS